MKQILLIGYLYLVGINLYSQCTLEYYNKINEAKVAVLENDIESAMVLYEEVFKNTNYPFARDCYHAVELAIMANDTIKLSYFLRKAITVGIKIEDIEEAGKVNSYLDRPFYHAIKVEEDSLMQIYTSRINWDIREEVNQLFLEDQKIREEYYSANFLKRKKIGKKWEELNARQVDRLIEITKEYGFPGEKLIGLDRTEMHPKIRTKNYSAGMPIVIFIHHFSQPNPSYDELLLAEVEKGNLYNEHFATICDFEAEFGSGKYKTFGYYGLRQQPKVMNDNILNLKREKIGLLKIAQIKQLNKIKHLTKFWNRLY